MRINELLVEQQLDELGLGQVGTIAGRALGGTAKALGATVGGVKGAWDAAKQGYQTGKATVSGQPVPPGPQGSNTVGAPKQQVVSQPLANQPTASLHTQSLAVQQQQSQVAQQQQKIGLSQINKIIPTLNSSQITSIKKAVDQRAQALANRKAPPTSLQTATGTQPAAGATAQIPATPGSTGYSGMPPAGAIANQPGASGNGRTFEGKEFYSKFLGKNL